MRRLPNSVQDVADVIGEQKALTLVASASKIFPPSRGSGRAEQLQVYVPSNISPTHQLVRVLGWVDAEKLSRHFGGEILKLGNCAELKRAHRNEAIKRMAGEGVPREMIAQWFNINPRTVANVLESRTDNASD